MVRTRYPTYCVKHAIMQCNSSCSNTNQISEVSWSTTIEGLHERIEHLHIFFFLPITEWCSISDVLFTGGRGVSDFNVLKYY